MISFFNKHKKKLKLIVLVGWMIFYFVNITIVPFHPDEATQLFMSDDIDAIFKQPSSLFYSNFKYNDPKQIYRLLDSPITRYSIGVWRNLMGISALSDDWNWSLGWLENKPAIPTKDQLIIARLSVSWIFPISLILIYKLSKKIFNLQTAIIASFLFATNSIILLHTRRAMAESLLLFFLILSLWVIFSVKEKWLFFAAIPITLAINTKQSLIFLIPAFIGILFIRFNLTRKLLRQLIASFFIIIVLTFLLNPIIWINPTETIEIMFSKRTELLNSQIESIKSVSPAFILDTPSEKMVGLIAQCFITPPAYQDISNYHDYLEGSIKQYENIIFHQGYFRNIYFGTLNLILLFLSIFTIIRNKNKTHKIFLGITIFAFMEIMIVFPIPFQRYYLPLYPFIIILISYCLSFLFKIFKNTVTKTK